MCKYGRISRGLILRRVKVEATLARTKTSSIYVSPSSGAEELKYLNWVVAFLIAIKAAVFLSGAAVSAVSVDRCPG